MIEFLTKLFSSDLMPHGYCYLWKPEIVWLHAASDGLITLSYYFIPVILIYLVRKRQDLPFHWMFLMFGLFIFGCGTTHLMEIWTLWHGTYRLAGIIKAVTAGASLVTAALIVPLVPRALALPSPSQLRSANLKLQDEIRERRRVEAALERARSGLELRVEQRTSELARANRELQAEIAERRHAEEILRNQASLLDLAHDAIIVRDINDVITYWNSGAEETYGWPRRDALGSIAQQFLQSVYPSDLESIKAEVIRKGRWDGELLQTRRDGSQIVVASRWALQRDEEGTPVGMLQINTDITEQKRAAEAMQGTQAQLAHMARVTAVGELTASIAHEVNQPLAAVVTNGNACIRWLAGEIPNLEEARQAIMRIVKEGNRAGDVIRRIRSLMKKSPPQMAALDINELIGEVMALTRHAILTKNISLRTELAPDMPAVVGDRIQLQQVMLNLILNGIEATSVMSEGPRELLVTSARYEPNQVIVAVRDSGVGIDPKDIDRLFSPFYTTKPEGMGMGLSISRSLIEAHGGHLGAAPNEGRGATFQFFLPSGNVN